MPRCAPIGAVYLRFHICYRCIVEQGIRVDQLSSLLVGGDHHAVVVVVGIRLIHVVPARYG